MRRPVFIRDEMNKHSLRALMGAFEKWFPHRDYFVMTPKDAFEKMEKTDLALLSFSSASWDFYKDYTLKLKEKYPEINTICGGAHPSARSADMLEIFDAVCVGEGEITIRDVIERADDGKIEGLIHGERVENLDEFPVFPRKRVSLGPIEIIRGCPSACAYCQTPQLFKGKLRYRSPEMVTDEIKFALSRKGFADARFIAPDASSYYFRKDVNTNAIGKLLSSIRMALRENGKIFYGTFPSELDPKGVTEELVGLLVKYCDNKLIVLGLQSAHPQMQKIMHRRSGIEDTEKAINLLLDKGFEIVVDLIFGLPFETEETYEATYKFMEKWRGKITVHAHPFEALPGSKWENEQGTVVPERLINLVRSLEGIGKVFGHTVKQDKRSCRGKH